MAFARGWKLVLPVAAGLVAAGLVGWFLRDACLPDAAQPPTAPTTTAPAAVPRASPRTARAPRPEAPPAALPEPAPAPAPAPGDLRGATFLAGRVFLDGAPLANAPVVVVRTVGRESVSRSIATGPDGAYEVTGLDPGRADLQVGIPAAGGASAVLSVESLALVTGENHADVRIGEGDLAGEIAGRVEPPEGRTPESTFLPGLTRLVSAGSEWKLGTFVGTTPLDEKGGFRFRGLRAGRYRISLTEIAAGGRAHATGFQMDVDLSAGERKNGIQLGRRTVR